MSQRLSKNAYFASMAELVSQRGTCSRRKVGCVLVNDRGHVLSTGYNGNASGTSHCVDSPCAGAKLKSGEGLDKCEALHAEANALLQCKDVYSIDTAYVTHSPCIQCVKLLMNTSCKTIYFNSEYPHIESKDLWLSSHPDRKWVQCDETLFQ